MKKYKLYVRDQKTRKLIEVDDIPGIKINVNPEFEGVNSQVIVGAKNRFFLCSITLTKNNIVDIAQSRWKIRRLDALCEVGSNLLVSEDFSCHSVVMDIQEGRTIRIGKDCQFSSGIKLRTGDGHPIFDADDVINWGKDISIGDHVWIGQDVTVLKGSIVQNGSVVGIGSIVTKPFDKENVVIVGNPARVVKENIHWTRDLLSRM